MNVQLVKNSKVIGKTTPTWSILHDGKFVCGGGTQYDALRRYEQPGTHGTIANECRLGHYRRIGMKLAQIAPVGKEE